MCPDITGAHVAQDAALHAACALSLATLRLQHASISCLESEYDLWAASCSVLAGVFSCMEVRCSGTAWGIWGFGLRVIGAECFAACCRSGLGAA